MPRLSLRRLFRVAATGPILAASLARAQTTDAAILGRVADTAGVPLPGVSVAARNVATGAEWTLTTNGSGRFAFVQLPLGGPYTVTARRIGYRPEAQSGYDLTLGRRVLLDVTMHRAPTDLPSVTVAGTESQSRRANLGGNLRVDAEALARVPAANRNFTDLASLAPTTGVQSSLLGQRWTSTDVRVDGAQARNMLRAGEFGAGPFTVSIEAIREFEVSTSVYDVTQGRQGGGSIRAATRAGTNSWTGSAFTYYRGTSLSAPTDYQGHGRDVREFGAVQWGASVGGPIAVDRAHLFLAFDRQDANAPLFSGLVQTAGDEVTNGIARDSLNRLVRILAGRYALDTARPQIGRLEARPVANNAFARLDWTLSPIHRLTVTHNLSAWNSPLSGGVDQPIALLEARSNYHSLEQQTMATFQSVLSSGLQNALAVGVATSDRELTPNSRVPRGFVRIQSGLSDGTTGDIKVQFGGNRLAPDDSRERQLQLIDNAYVQRGNVLWTAGTDNTLTALDTYIAESQSGLFEFNSLADLDARRAFRYSRTLPLEDPQPHTTQRVLELGAYVQAEWRPRADLTAALGLRWDGTAFLDAARRDTLVERVLGRRTDRAPSDWTKLQPRAQLVWDAHGQGRDIVRIGAGRFAAQAPYYQQHNQLLNDGRRIADITLTGAAVPVPDYAAYRTDPSKNPGIPAGAAPPPPYVNLVAPGFRTPGVWKATAAYRRTMTTWLAVTGTLLFARTTDDYVYVDRNLRSDAAFTLANEANRPVFVPAATIDPQGRTLNANALAHRELGRVLELTSGGSGRQRAAILEASLTLPRNARADISYTYNHADDNTTYGCCLARTATTFTAITGDPRDLSGSWGPSDADFRQKLVVSAVLPEFWGVRVSGRYVGSNGRPFSAVVNGDINGDEATSNDLAFVFDPDNKRTPRPVADAMRRVLANPNNVARNYLSANLGRIASRNGVFAPWVGHADMRVTRAIGTIHGQWIEIGLDVFNVASLLNPAWGAEYQLPIAISNQNPVVQRIPLLNVVGFNQATRQYVYTVNENFGVLAKSGTPYQMQLSARYGF
ncbi:MAG TPA: carboxypeptidase-like regulatory domain-containing protein [Gemmatimonadaceae bacterium]|nr:carboxypeptidase-like regulatory domain-containing protein [Gemmatimonadaceae bacterium]